MGQMGNPKHYRQLYLEAFLKAPGDPITKEYVLPALVDQLMREDGLPVEVLETSAVWFGITYQEDKAAVQADLKALHDKGDYPESLD